MVVEILIIITVLVANAWFAEPVGLEKINH
jgi:hypothetical protein